MCQLNKTARGNSRTPKRKRKILIGEAQLGTIQNRQRKRGRVKVEKQTNFRDNPSIFFYKRYHMLSLSIGLKFQQFF
jgi:hypothetical protein